MADIPDCAQCDIEERTELYEKHMPRGRVIRGAAQDLADYSIRESGVVEHSSSERAVNPEAFKYEKFAEMKVLYGMEPEDFAREVLLMASKGA